MKIILNFLLLKLIQLGKLRTRIISIIKSHYYKELENKIPLEGNLYCPILYENSLCSFNEIFGQGEYRQFINKIDLPEKWLDLGCHLGHFSLQLNSLRRSAGKKLGKGLLIDADSRIIDSIDKTIEINSLETYFKFKSGVLGSNKNTYFYEDDFMSSSNIESIRKHAKKRKVKLITENEIINLLAPPYDLVKVDIEGGEYEFLKNYQMILRQTKYLFLEWHSWHSGGGGFDQIKECIEKLNFSIIDETRAQKTIDNRGETGLIFAKFASE